MLEAKGNEIAFKNAIQVRIKHYQGVHDHCNWEKHNKTPLLEPPAAFLAFEVFSQNIINLKEMC